MAKIHAVRVYQFYDEEYADVMYESGRLVSYAVNELPQTVKDWMVDKDWTVQYDKVYKRNEVIYKDKGEKKMRKYIITYCWGNYWMERATIEAEDKSEAVKVLMKRIGMPQITTNKGQEDFLGITAEFAYIDIKEAQDDE